MGVTVGGVGGWAKTKIGNILMVISAHAAAQFVPRTLRTLTHQIRHNFSVFPVPRARHHARRQSLHSGRYEWHSGQ